MSPIIKKQLFFLLGCVLFLIAAARPVGFDRDSLVYHSHFEAATSNHWENKVEYSYYLFSCFCDRLHVGFRGLLVFFAFLTVMLKTVAIPRLTQNTMLAMLVWSANYFLLHDMTQIRVAVSASLLLLAIPYIVDSKRWHAFFLILVAVFFHVSAIALLPIIFFSDKKMSVSVQLLLLIMPLLTIAFGTIPFHLENMNIPYVSDKVMIYQQELKNGGFAQMNRFNLVFLVRWLLFSLILLLYNRISDIPYLNILTKVLACSVFCSFAFYQIPVFCFRFSELFGIVEIPLYASIACNRSGMPSVIRWGVVLFAVGYFILHIYINAIFA